MSSSRKSKAFTLIELLIVVAIIGILAAIAIPNFLEAQTRSKVAKVKSDHRTLAAAMEMYLVDNNSYPFDHDNNPYHNRERGFCMLTTPVAYLSSTVFGQTSDPFSEKLRSGDPNYSNVAAYYAMGSGADNFMENLPVVQCYAIISIGPDHLDSTNEGDSFPWITSFLTYDPTNGTVSNGDILRFGGQYRSGNWAINGFRWSDYPISEVMPE